MTETPYSDVPSLRESLSNAIVQFKTDAEKRGLTRLFAKITPMLEKVEQQRAEVFDRSTGYYDKFRDAERASGTFKETDYLSLLAKLVATMKTLKRTLKNVDDVHDTADYAAFLYKEITRLFLLFNGDGIDERPIFKNGAFYTFSGASRPASPFFQHLKLLAISFVRPLHSMSSFPEFEETSVEKDWEKVDLEMNWSAFIK